MNKKRWKLKSSTGRRHCQATEIIMYWQKAHTYFADGFCWGMMSWRITGNFKSESKMFVDLYRTSFDITRPDHQEKLLLFLLFTLLNIKGNKTIAREYSRVRLWSSAIPPGSECGKLFTCVSWWRLDAASAAWGRPFGSTPKSGSNYIQTAAEKKKSYANKWLSNFPCFDKVEKISVLS